MAEIPECPRGREEEYLADIAGLTDNAPKTPWSRKEAYLQAIDDKVEDIEEEIEELKNNPDVADIVATYADLEAYDTSKLTDKDIIRVLADETHDGASTYYRWSASTQTFTYIGEVGDYYTKGQTDILLADKQDKLTAGANVTISSENVISATDTTYDDFVGFDEQTGTAGTHGLVPAPIYGPQGVLCSDGTWKDLFPGSNINITYYDGYIDISSSAPTYTAGSNITISSDTISATDTTYSNFVGTDGTADGTAGLVPAPATTDAGKFLKADGTWDTAGGGGVTPVQTIGTSTTDVMSQDAVTKMIYPNYASSISGIGIGTDAPARLNCVGIGHYITMPNRNSVCIGAGAKTGGQDGVSIGYAVTMTSQSKYCVGIGSNATVKANGSIALGSYSETNYVGEVNVGSTDTTYGYNSTNYRKITGVHDGENLHDCATIAQANLLSTSAPTTSTVGVLGQLYTDTTNMHTYQCTAIDTVTDPDNPSYTWTQRW